MSLLRSELVGRDDQVLLVRLPDKLVDETAGPVRDAVATKLPAMDGAGLVLDFSGVALINSIGITCLLQVQDLCSRRGAAMLLAGVPAPIRTFFSRLKLDARFSSRDSVEQAVAELDDARDPGG